MGLLTEPKMALMGAGVSWVPSPQGGPETGGAVCVPNRADACVPTGRLCWDLAGYFLWPFGKVIQKVEVKACPESGPYGEGWLGCPIPNPDTPHVPPQVPKSRRVLGTCEASAEASGAGETSALLGGPVPRRWRPRCWADVGHWVSPVLNTVTPFASAWSPWELPIMVGTAPMGASTPLGWVVWPGQTLKVTTNLQQCAGTVAWLCLGYPVLVLAHGLVCITAWLLVFLIPVAKLSARTTTCVLLLPPERVLVRRLKMVGASVPGSCTLLWGGFLGWGWCSECCHPLVPPQTEVPLEGEVILCCYRAVNPYYYKYAVDGINVFAVSILLWAGGERGGEAGSKSHSTSVISLTGHPRLAAVGAGDTGAGLRGQPQPLDQLPCQVHVGPALHHASLLLHRDGHCQVSGDGGGTLGGKVGTHAGPADTLLLLQHLGPEQLCGGSCGECHVRLHHRTHLLHHSPHQGLT